MPAKIDLTGKRFGRLTVLYEVDPYVSPGGHELTKWHCRCICGNNIDIIGNSLKKGKTKSCGCYHKEMAKDANTKHGLCYTWQYKRAKNAITRCHNPHNKSFIDYGARGIYVCKEWRDNPGLFAQYLIGIDFPKNKQIDRIDNNKGYEPGNIRPATNRENVLNQRFLTKSNKSGYRGVSFNKELNKWLSQIQIDGKYKYLGSFNTPEEAAKAYNREAIKHGYPLNEIKKENAA